MTLATGSNIRHKFKITADAEPRAPLHLDDLSAAAVDTAFSFRRTPLGGTVLPPRAKRRYFETFLVINADIKHTYPSNERMVIITMRFRNGSWAIAKAPVNLNLKKKKKERERITFFANKNVQRRTKTDNCGVYRNN